MTGPAILVLEDGRAFRGTSFGAAGEAFGEMVFNTGMTGYQETLTDPSYCRQIVAMTAPHIGNTGVNDEDPESGRIWVSGYVIREPARVASSWRSARTLEDELRAQDVTGIAISGSFLSHAYTSPVTLGVLFGYVAGKPLGITGTAWLVTKLSRGRLRPPVGWASVAGAGAVAGIGFTISLLIATHAFHGVQLEEAKLGVLSAALCASLLTWLVFRATALLPRRLRIRALLGTSDAIVDLAEPVDPERDHVRGPAEAPVTVVEYGDFECPYCGRAEPAVRELLKEFGDVRYVWRHLPLTDVHPHARAAAEAAEAAAEQGAFWEMHDLLLDHQDELKASDLIRRAEELGLDVQQFENDLERRAGSERIDEDVDSADLSGVSGTPTFFINDRRHYGAYDVDTLSAAVKAARARAVLKE